MWPRIPWLLTPMLVLAASLALGTTLHRVNSPLASEQVRRTVESVIFSQIAALMVDDATAAFSMLSAEFQQHCGSREAYMKMMRRDHFRIYRPGSFQFLGLGLVEGEVVQQLVVTGGDGIPIVVLVPLIEDGQNAWKINGWVVFRPKASSA